MKKLINQTLIFSPLLMIFLFAGTNTLQAAETISIEEFLEMEPKWDQLVRKETTLTIEGRITSISKSLLFFRNCNVPFRSNRKNGFRVSTVKSRTVEAYGTLKLKDKKLDKDSDESKYYFEVSHLKVVPSDLNTVESKKSFLKKDSPEEWKELANWTLNRAEFYEDEELKKEGEEIFFESFLIEKNLIPPGKYKPIFGLIDKIKKQKFETISPDDEIRVFLHEAYRRWWDEIQSQKLEGAETLVEEIENNLPGSKIPVSEKEYQLKDSYEKDPVKVYEQTEAENRKILHRIFLTEILYATIMSQVDPEGINGYEIAERLEKKVPEIKKVPEELRQKEIAYKKTKIRTLTRGEILDLAKKLDDRNEKEEKKEVLTEWLELRTKKEKAEGPAGLILIARDYVSLLEDEKSAFEVLLQAYEMNPDSEETAKSLRDLGYELEKGQWIPTENVKPTKLTEIQEAMKSGEVVKEMTTEQVIKTLGKPVTVTKMISQKEIDIIWTYGEQTGTRLVVHLTQHRGKNPSPAKVISVSQLRNE